MKKNLHFLQKLFTVKKPVILMNLVTVIFSVTSPTAFSQNPLLLKSPLTGASGRSIEKIVSTTSGKTFFNTIDNNNHFSNLWGLWTTDGTQAGTVKLSLTYPGYTTTEANLLTPLGNNKIAFAGDNEQGYGEIWATDGTQAGTIALQSFIPGISGPPVLAITSLNNDVIYAVTNSNKHLQLRKTNGTPGDTSLVYDFGLNTVNPNGLAYFKTIGNIIYFELSNGTTTHNEIWRTDGTQAGTYQVKDLGQDYGFASEFMAFGNNIYFITVSSTFGDYIWKSDGTTTGTAPLKQISTTFNFDNYLPSYAATSTVLYFAANNSINGKELWKTDGTPGGTSMFVDLYTGSTSSNPNWLTVLNDQLYFSADAGGGMGNELYHYDGNFISAGDIFQGSTGSNPSNLTVQNNTLLFSATRNTTEGNELWVRDGSNFNCIEIANINPVANASSNPSLISVSGNSAYFAASFDANGDGIDDPCIYKYTQPGKIWTGTINSDGSNIDNWFPQGVPANGDNILFPANPVNNFSNPFLFCGDFINNGSTINIGGGLVLFSGNFYNTGGINNASGGVFGMTSNNTNVPHTFGNYGYINGQFTMATGVNMQLTATSYIPILRVEGPDSIYLGNYNLTVGSFGLFLPKVITDSTGNYIMPVGSAPVIFPVAPDKVSYNPVTITNNGTSDYFSVNVKNGVYTNGTSGNLVSQQAVNKTWNIDESTPGGSDASITLQWNASDELTGFDRNNVYLNHYTNGAWDSGTPGIAAGSGPFTFSRSGITSFSPFSISSATGVLPVNLISFSANKLGNSIMLNWQIATEKNISRYILERSKDAVSFSELGEVVPSVSTSINKNYSYTDENPFTGTGFYRLKMLEADGKFTYSKTVAIKIDGKIIGLRVFPNPAKNILHIQASGSSEALLQIIDMTGKKIKEQKITLNENTSVSIDINNLPNGTYTLLLKGKSINAEQKFVKE